MQYSDSCEFTSYKDTDIMSKIPKLRQKIAKMNKLIEAKMPHNIPNQLNIYVPDIESCVTSFGKHNRLIISRDVLLPNSITIREDDIGLTISTEDDRMFVACNTYQRQHPKNTKLELVNISEDFNNVLNTKVIWYDYRIINNNK